MSLLGRVWNAVVVKPVKAIAKAVDKGADWVNKEIIQPVLKTVKNTVTAILKDPLPFIAQIAGSFVGIPPYVTAAAITAMRGGSITDIAKNAAIAYVGSKAFSGSTYGKALGETGASVNDFTASLAKDYGLSASTATVVGNAAQSGFTSAALNGFKAAITGKDVGDAITNGFVSGSVSSASNSYFSDVNNQKDWGISANTAKQVSGLTSSAGTALLTGRDPEQAMANYVVGATTATINSEFKKTASYLWDQAKTYANATTEAKKTYDTTQAKFDSTAADLQAKVDAFNTERDKINAARDPYVTAYNTNLGEYNKNKAIYDDANQTTDARNAAADKMNAYAAEMQKAVDGANSFNPQLEALNQKAQDIQTVKQGLTDPNVGIAKELKAASEAVQANYDSYNKTLEDAKAADDQYGKQVAEVATREAIVDSINKGDIKTVDNPDAPPGSVTLSNGMVITADGKYLQDGKEVFANAAGVDQGKLDFKTESGDHYVFDKTGQRLTSETDAMKLAENEFGVKLDAKEAAKFADVPYGTLDPLKAVAEEKVAEQLKQYGYKAPSQEMVDSFIQKGGDTLSFVDQFIDPYSVSKDEVNAFYRDILGRDATPEEIKNFAGAKTEADILNEKSAAQLKSDETLRKYFGQYDGPIYAETAEGMNVAVPPGYRIASIADVNDKEKTGAIFDPGVNAWLMPTDPSLSPVTVTAQNESYLQDFFGDYYRSPTDSNPSLDEVTVVGKREEESPWEEGFPVNEDPSLDEVTVTAKREEDPLVDLTFSPLSPNPPVTSVTVPKTPTTKAPATTTAKKPASASDALISALMGGTTATTQQAAQPTPVVEQSRVLDIGAPLDIGFFDQPTGLQNTNQEDPGVVKIASGGYMDILFPKQGMSMDEILRILEGTHHGR